jgi:hypothetical protein
LSANCNANTSEGFALIRFEKECLIFHIANAVYTIYVHRMNFTLIQTVYIQYTNMKRIGFNIPDELVERLDLYCQQNFTNRTEALKAWIKTLPLEESIKKKKSIK